MIQFLIQHSPIWYFAQSIWRDEAFSILVAEKPLSQVLGKLSFEPPLYYTFLHVWIRLFGNNELVVRGLSFFGFFLATIIVIFWAKKLYKSHWLSLYLPVIFFLNPMLIYYAFEIRTYGWYIFFAVLTLFGYIEKRWIVFIIGSILGFYTHTYVAFLIASLCIHWSIVHRSLIMHPRELLRTPAIHSMIFIALSTLPWIIRIIEQSDKLKASWYYSIGPGFIYSVLGNMFVGYEGTPWFLWRYTAYLSAALMVMFIISLKNPIRRHRNIIFLSVIAISLGIVIVVSLKKPIFVNRYLIPVTIAETFLVVAAIREIKNRYLQPIIAGSMLLFIIIFNAWYPQEHPKLDIRRTITEINAIKKPDDEYFVNSSLILFETVFYSKDRSKVFLYNPERSAFPWYVGDAVYSPSYERSQFPVYPIRAFLIHEDGTYEVIYRMPVGK